jgi:hypothetical protein
MKGASKEPSGKFYINNFLPVNIIKSGLDIDEL